MSKKDQSYKDKTENDLHTQTATDDVQQDEVVGEVVEEVAPEEAEGNGDGGAAFGEEDAGQDAEAGAEVDSGAGDDADPGADPAQTIAELRAKLEDAESKAEDHYQKFLRAQADFDNFRRRVRKEKEELAQYGSQPVIENLLPALDNFERALSAGGDTEDVNAIIKGVEMVYAQVGQALKDAGLEVIPTVGEPFDPHVHEAVMQVEDERYASGVIVEELQKGYKLKDKVIRPAMVKVNT